MRPPPKINYKSLKLNINVVYTINVNSNSTNFILRGSLMKKKLIALLLALICAYAFVFTACSDNAGNGQNNTDNGQSGEYNDCNEDNTGNGNDGVKDSHTHTFETEWSYDSTNHWHAAKCMHSDEVKDLAPHTFNDFKCTVCGYTEILRVGSKLIDFTVDTYESAYNENSYSTESARGKVLVINFWYTTCEPCVAELPEMEKVRKEYGDDVIILAIHSNNRAKVQDFIDRNSWNEWGIIFGQDRSIGGSLNGILTNCGGSTLFPFTLVVDTRGYIIFAASGKVIGSYVQDKLHPAIEKALGNI